MEPYSNEHIDPLTVSLSVLFSCTSLALQANPGTWSLVETKELEQTNEGAYGV